MTIPTGPSGVIDEVAATIGKLNGCDCVALLAKIRAIRAAFHRMDGETASFLQSSDDVLLARALAPNHRVFSDEEPLEESIFLYFDLSTSVELVNYMVRIRGVTIECLGPGGFKRCRWADLSLQHATAFIEMIGPGLNITDQMVEAAMHKYEALLQGLLPFNLVVKGPHLVKNGGVVLEGAAYSLPFFRLRETAANDTRGIPDSATRPLPTIIHSTIGYVSDATKSQMQQLNAALASMRPRARGISVRIREGRLSATANRGLVGKCKRMGFCGQRLPNADITEVRAGLGRVKEVARAWMGVEDIRNLVQEEALYWSECGTDETMLGHAHELLGMISEESSGA